MKRSPIARTAPRDALDVRRFREAVLDRARGQCEAAAVLVAGPVSAVAAARRCRGQATSAHHVEPRGMGGHGWNDPANGLAVCSACHDFIESHRALAYDLHLLARHGRPR